MSKFNLSEFPRILLGSDNQHLVSAFSHALHQAGFSVDIATHYRHVEELWHDARQEVVLFEVSHPDSVESATESAVRIKQQDAGQFIAYLADQSLRMSGLTGDAIFTRDPGKLPQALHDAFQAGT